MPRCCRRASGRVAICAVGAAMILLSTSTQGSQSEVGEKVHGTYVALFPKAGECQLKVGATLTYTLRCGSAPQRSGQAVAYEGRLYLEGGIEAALETHTRLVAGERLGDQTPDLMRQEPAGILEMVPWGPRLYLVAPDQRMLEFCYAVANGEEPRRSLAGPFFLRKGDQQRAASTPERPEVCKELEGVMRPRPEDAEREEREEE